MYFYDMFSAAIMILTGAGFFIFSSSLNKPALFIPAGILASSGGILYYQGYTGNWASWVYLWPLTFAGLGLGFMLYNSNKPNENLAWLGRIWCGLAFIFTAINFTLHYGNPKIFNWPIIILGIGFMFLIPGINFKYRAFRIPGFFFSGLGSIFMIQYITHNWQSWRYVWALLPAFIGLGIITASAKNKKAVIAGNIILGISSILFLVFATVFSNYWQIVRYWPLLLILLGFLQYIKNYQSGLPVKKFKHQKQEALE